MKRDQMAFPRKTINTMVEELAYRAKLNKPSSDWVTSEWDRTVELVAAAMKEPIKVPPRG